MAICKLLKRVNLESSYCGNHFAVYTNIESLSSTPGIDIIYQLHLNFKKIQRVKGPTLGFGSGPDHRVLRLSSRWATGSAQSQLKTLSHSPSAPHPAMCTITLSKIKEKILFKKIQRCLLKNCCL